jgi:succinoglycan biosynthesis transport protein ExoP
LTLFELVGLLRRQWPLVLAGAVLGMLAALVVGLLLPTSYTAATRLYVTSTGPTPEIRLQNSEYARTRMSSYAELVDSAVVLDAVRRNLKIAPTDHLVDGISATNPLDSLILDIDVTDSSPQQAEAVADGISQVLDSAVSGLETGRGVAESPVKVAVVRPAERPDHPNGLSTKLLLTLGLLLGVVLGIVGARTRDSWQRQAATGLSDHWTSDGVQAHRPGVHPNAARHRDDIHP